MDCFNVIILFGVLSTTVAETGLSLLFPLQNQIYVYDFKTNVSIDTQSVTGKSSLWLLEGTLKIQTYYNYTTARVYLDVTKKTLTGNIGSANYHELEGDKFLKHPWELDYQDNGFIKSIYVSEEPTWSVNLKRAISVNFQLTRNAGQTTYSLNEPCLDEICTMVYNLKGSSIRKYTSYRVPTARSSYSWGSVPWTVEYGGPLFVDSVTTAERNYEMDPEKGLLNLVLRGSYQYKTHDHILSVTSDLYLNYKGDLPAERTEKLNLSQTTIQYVAGDFSDPTTGIANSTQFYLSTKSYNILLKIARKGIDADNIVRNASLIHNLDFIELLNTMSQLNYESLIKLFNDLVLGTSYDMETSRNIYLEILPHVRSDACARFIKYLVLEEKEKVEDAALLSLIRKLPFNIATHSQRLLEELEVFTKLGLDFPQDIRHAGILSFATLAHKTMEAGQVKHDYFDNIVVKYFRMYGDCPRYLDRMIWLQGLCNIGYSAESYTRIISADNTRDRHERLWATLAGSPNTEVPYMVLESTLPILTNDTEDIQLRILSAHMFLSSSNIRETDFYFVHNYILNCGSKTLKKFWFSTVRNLALNRDFIGYRVASFYVPFVASQVPPVDAQRWATNNYIISGQLDDGAPSLQVLSIGEDVGALPGFVGVRLYTGGRRPYKAAVYLIVEGVISKSEFKHTDINIDNISTEKLHDILKSFKNWTIKKSEKLHIDVVVKLHDKTVFATHMNQTRFERWNKEDFAYIVDFLRFGSHINQQLVYYPFQTDVHISTEIGTPIRLQSTILSFTSIRGNLTAPSGDEETWRNDLHIRYQGTAVTTLSTAAPLLETVHVGRIQQSLVAHLPMRFNISVYAHDKSVVLTWPNPGDQQAGVAMHSRAEVATETKTEGYDYMLRSGEVENRKDSIFFDCERPMTGAEVLNKLLASNSKHQDLFHSIHPSLVILNGIVLFSSPPSGSCGVILQPRLTSSDDVLELKIQAKRLAFGGATEMELFFGLNHFSLDNPNQVFLKVDSTAILESSYGKTKVDLKLEAQRPNSVESLKRGFRVSVIGEERIDTSIHQDLSNTPAAFNGTLDVVFNGTSNAEPSESKLLVEYRGLPGVEENEFRVEVWGRNLSNMNFLHLDLMGQTAWGQLLKTHRQDPFNLTAVLKENNGLASLSVNESSAVELKVENFAWLLNRWTNLQLSRNFGYFGECRIKPTQIDTMSGDVIDLPASRNDQELLVADCASLKPRFAVIQTGDGLKVYSWDHHVEITTSNNQTVVDETLSGNEFMISKRSDTYQIDITRIGLYVFYSASEVVILIPRSYLSTVCGICTNKEYKSC